MHPCRRVQEAMREAGIEYEKVIAARTQLAAQQDLRERTAAELAQADLVIKTHQAFQGEFDRGGALAL